MGSRFNVICDCHHVTHNDVVGHIRTFRSEKDGRSYAKQTGGKYFFGLFVPGKIWEQLESAVAAEDLSTIRTIVGESRNTE